MIQLRPYTPDDYPLMVKWWEGHGWPVLPASVLPALGMIAENNGTPAAAAWVYLDNSTGVGLMEWMVTNPANSPQTSARAIYHVAECLKAAAKEIGYGVIHASCRQASLARLLERAGFTRMDDGVIHLLSVTH